MIMSKMEIVQNNQENAEIQKDDKILQEIMNLNIEIQITFKV